MNYPPPQSAGNRLLQVFCWLPIIVTLIVNNQWDAMFQAGNYYDLTHMALIHKWSFANRIHSTYGPLAFLGLESPRDELYWLSIVGHCLVIGFVYWRLWRLASPRLSPGWRPLWATLVLLPFAPQGVRFYTPGLFLPYLTLFLLVYEWTNRNRPEKSEWVDWGYGILLASHALMKVSYWPVVAAATCCTLLLGALHGQFLRASRLLGKMILAGLAFWMLSGQSLFEIPAYVAATKEVISGYSATMSLWMKYTGETLFWLVLFSIFVALLPAFGAIRLNMFSGWILWGMLTLIVAHNFLAGAVRADYSHLFPAWSALGSLSIFLLTTLIFPDRQSSPTTPHDSTAPVANITNEISTTRTETLGQRLRLVAFLAFGLVACRPLWIIEQHLPILWFRFQSMCLSIRSLHNPVFRRGIDIPKVKYVFPGEPPLIPDFKGKRVESPIEFDGLFLVASQAILTPRPTLTSYSAYTPWLSAENRRFLESPNGPEIIVQHDGGFVDLHYPTVADNQSFLSLLSHYRPGNTYSILYTFNRRSSPLQLKRTLLSEGETPLNRPVPVPDVPFVWAEIDAQIQNNQIRLLQPVWLAVSCNSSDGQLGPFTLPKQMARDGFVLSPYLGESKSLAKFQIDDPQCRKSPDFVTMKQVSFHGFTHDAFDTSKYATGTVKYRFYSIEVMPTESAAP